MDTLEAWYIHPLDKLERICVDSKIQVSVSTTYILQ